MGQRLEALGEGLRNLILVRNRAKFWSIVVSVSMFTLVQIGVLTSEQAQKIDDLYRTIILGEEAPDGEPIPSMRAQLVGISELVGEVVPTERIEPASIDEQTARIGLLERDLAEIERAAAQICGPEVAVAECLVSRERDRQQAWAGRERAVDEAVNQVSNELAAAQARLAQMEAQYAGKTCVPDGQWSDAIRRAAQLVCPSGSDGQ